MKVINELAQALNPPSSAPVRHGEVSIPMVDVPSISPAVRRVLRKGQARLVAAVVRDVESHKPLQHLQRVYVSSRGARNLLDWYEQRQSQPHRQLFSVNLCMMAVAGAIAVHDTYIKDEVLSMGEFSHLLQPLHRCAALEKFSDHMGQYAEQIQCLREIQSRIYLQGLTRNTASLLLRAESLRRALFANSAPLAEHLDCFSPQRQQLLLSFIATFLDVLPKMAFVEAQATYSSGAIAMGDRVLRDTYGQYFRFVELLRQWHQRAILPPLQYTRPHGCLTGHTIRHILGSRVNRLLLTTTV